MKVAGDVSGIFGRQSPLILAVEANDLDLVRRLLERGADPHRFEDFYGRALHAAAEDDAPLHALAASFDVQRVQGTSRWCGGS